MLDKQSEKVLKHIISKYDGNAENDIDIIPSEIKMGYTELNSLCHSLYQQGFLTTYWRSTLNNTPAKVRLTHQGLHYFEVKKLTAKDNFNRSIVVPIAVTLLTQLLLFLSKQLLLLI